jgi:hypothetical protein
MKRKLILMLACLAFFVQGVYAQDVIMKKNGDDVKAKIAEIATEYVKYKKFENPTGPDYTIDTSDIFMIKYEDGSKDMFEKNPQTGKIQVRHVDAETAPQNAPVQQPPVSVPKPETAGSAGSTAPATAGTAPLAPTKQTNNGTLKILGFNGGSVSFRAMVETPFYSVSMSSGEHTFKASNISNTKGNILVGGGVTATPGSSLLLGSSSNIWLPEGTEATCRFDNVPAGFVPKTFVFLTDEKAAPMSYDFAAGEWIKLKRMNTQPEPVAPAPQPVEQDIVELLENNIIEAEITGKDITQINLRVRRLVPDAVNVRIPVGSFFVAENPASQNMVATAEKKERLTTNSWTNISIPAACANRPKDIPDSKDKFSIQRSPKQEELALLMPVLEKAEAHTLVKQAAVWIVTDDADFDDLGILTDASDARVIWYETATRAMKACADAGIDITKKRIWNDRKTILSKLSAGELKRWLQGLTATPAASTPTATPAPTASAAPTATQKIMDLVNYVEGDIMYQGAVTTIKECDSATVWFTLNAKKDTLKYLCYRLDGIGMYRNASMTHSGSILSEPVKGGILDYTDTWTANSWRISVKTGLGNDTVKGEFKFTYVAHDKLAVNLGTVPIEFKKVLP